MIKAVIFDCFGVLTTDGWKQLREEFFALDDKKMQHAFDIDKAVNAGYMDYNEFIQEIVNMSGLHESDVRSRLDGLRPNESLLTFIRDELKEKVQIGLLSNAAGNWLGELFEPWQAELFDVKVLSFEVGMVKPDPAVYELILKRLGVQANESIFIDDSERYCVAAEGIGIHTIYHRDTSETIARIKELLNA